MSIFKKILDTLGVESAEAATIQQTKTQAAEPESQQLKAISEVDVMSQLEARANAAGGKLNWKNSIVDLLRLLDLDASKEARIELAKELNCPADKIGGDYSQMNIWLHKKVIQKIAENGGNIPSEML